ncbi:uncharacterized protein ALTATR162_LOCUS9828 [Alternaria atra]|uniref:Uncharacterized protein n=1 Tax=Alternaria atra TaxID=119953 RepID=A0A8J2I919_9PLEO|nr:uncharacterized protein ALTATR162_LOCUS9828 [Alternaria atra]CAG5181775.1 unnamed protein product [Alternaria atra]
MICYKRFYEGEGKKKSVPNPPPDKVMKDTISGLGAYNDQIKKVSMMTSELYAKKTSENQHLWDDLDDAVNKIKKAREGDHGFPYAIDNAKEKFKDVLEIKTEDLGENPGSGEKWEKVDWKETWEEARSNGFEKKDLNQRFREYFDGFYGKESKSKAPRSHIAVIRSFKRAQDRAKKCRQKPAPES